MSQAAAEGSEDEVTQPIMSGSDSEVDFPNVLEDTSEMEADQSTVIGDVAVDEGELPLDESMIEFRERSAEQLDRLRQIEAEMEEGMKTLTQNTAALEVQEEALDLSVAVGRPDKQLHCSRSSTPTSPEDIDFGRGPRAISPSISDISSIAGPDLDLHQRPTSLSVGRGYAEPAGRVARAQAFAQNMQIAKHEEEQRRRQAECDYDINQRIATVDRVRQKYHNERRHALHTMGQTIAVNARQADRLKRINMLTTRVSTSKATTQSLPKKKGGPVKQSSPCAARRERFPTQTSSRAPQRRHTAESSRALATWPLDQSLVSREGSNPNSTAGVHDSEARGTRSKSRRKSHTRTRGGGGNPPSSSEDSSEEDSSSDSGSEYNSPRRRFNRHTKRVELKPNCFNGKNWPSYKLHFLSCVEGNGWSKKMAVKVLKTKLVDDAAYVLQQRQNGVWSMKGLLGALDCRYSQVGGPNYLIRQALHYAHQTSKESLQHYVDRIMGIVWRKLNDPELEDQLALDQFLVGVIDPELQQFLGEQPRMKSLFDALKMARDWELSEQHTRERKAGIKLGKGSALDSHTETGDDRLQLMRQLEKEKDRNKQLQVNAEVDRRLRNQEGGRQPRNDFRNQSTRYEQSPRGPPASATQEQAGFHQNYGPPRQQPQHNQQFQQNQGNYPRQSNYRGGYQQNRGGYRNQFNNNNNQNYQQGPPPQQSNRDNTRGGDVGQGPPPARQPAPEQQNPSA